MGQEHYNDRCPGRPNHTGNQSYHPEADGLSRIGLSALVARLCTQRADLLAVLEPLPPEDWCRTAVVTGAGKPLVGMVLSYVRRLAIHEHSHLKQIERILYLTRRDQQHLPSFSPFFEGGTERRERRT